MAAAAAAQPADAVVRLAGVSVAGHALRCEGAGESSGGRVVEGWCVARFEIPLEAVAGLVGFWGCGEGRGSDQEVLEALCGRSESEPGLLCGMLCCVFAECAELFPLMLGKGKQGPGNHTAEGGGGGADAGHLPPVSPVSSGPSPLSQPSSGEHRLPRQRLPPTL
jgi:hypothetical protein